MTTETDPRVDQIIAMADFEKAKAQNFRNLYQEVANLIYPVENQITSFKTPGEDKSLDIRDPTGQIALDKATAGFIAAWIPKDREFFGIRIKNRKIAELDHVKRWVALAVQIAHEELFESNYLQQLQQTTKATIGFGIGCSYSEFDIDKLALNFKDRHVSTYTIKEGADGRVDTVILELPMTARQACEYFDKLNGTPGEQVTKDANDLKTESKLHEFIHIARPHHKRNVRLITSDQYPWESIYVNRKEKIICAEGGYEEFCYAVPRWEKSSVEKYGRGQGTKMLSALKELQQMRRDFLECGNRWNNPPLETVDSNIEGPVDTSPGARNHVMERDSIRAINQTALGSFPITMEVLRFQQDLIKNDGFYNDVFSQFRSLQGDRRVTLELELRNQEGLDQLVAPVINMESELFTPQLTRAVLLLIRNGRIPRRPPAELSNQPFGLEYKGKLAMAMKQYQARAIWQFTQILPTIEASFPGAKDTINMDRALPDIAISMGIKAEHLSTPEEIAAKRQERIERDQQLMMMQAAAAAGQTYKDTSKAAEEDSPAANMMASV